MEQPILDGLISYNTQGSYPWHMPGHKRRLQTIFPELVDNPFSIDVTEVGDLDEYHNPTGMIRESQEMAAKVYGSGYSYYLVNGSTSGILTAISSVCKYGDTIVVARNCHTSVYHAIRLLNLKPVYIMPEWNDNIEMFGSISADAVKKALKENASAKAVVLVSPTYEGVVSDVEKIAKIVHKSKIPLIVDEAHGAHFEFTSNVNETISDLNYKNIPSPAIRLGADIVIESLHKTLPAMTQCGIMHVKSSLVNRNRIKEYLSIYQSSSPSYVFMATMEACIEKMDRERDGAFIIYKQLIAEYRKKFGQLQHIHLVDSSDFKKNKIHGYDHGKLVFSVKKCGIQKGEKIVPFTGVMLGTMLNEEYGQMVEMMADSYIIAMTSVADTKEAFEALFLAMESIDHQLIDLTELADIYMEEPIHYNRVPERRMSIKEARDSQMNEIALMESVGRMSGEYIYIYPPGIPLVAPGEVISKDVINTIHNAIRRGLNLKGVNINTIGDGKDAISQKDIRITVVKENRWLSHRKLFREH